jgi:hypothetical protein
MNYIGHNCIFETEYVKVKSVQNSLIFENTILELFWTHVCFFETHVAKTVPR